MVNKEIKGIILQMCLKCTGNFSFEGGKNVKRMDFLFKNIDFTTENSE